MTRSSFALIALAVALTPLSLWGTVIYANGSSVSQVFGDDTNYSTTVDATFVTYSNFLLNGMDNAPFNGNGNLPVAFAGDSNGPASGIANIDSGDLSVTQYAPWVVNNNGNAGGNGMTGPDGNPYNRNITGAEAGGANILITYTPTGNDPTSINFIQAYIESTNGAEFTGGTIDSTSNSAYYNDKGVSGVGSTTNPIGGIPLTIEGDSNAWMLDIPYTCESGLTSNADCSGGVDDAVTEETVTFVAFVSETMDLNIDDVETPYNVLLGGVEWGYTYDSIDTPEPSTMLFAGGAIVLAWGSRRKLRARS
jgi:hypothetical protein